MDLSIGEIRLVSKGVLNKLRRLSEKKLLKAGVVENAEYIIQELDDALVNYFNQREHNKNKPR